MKWTVLLLAFLHPCSLHAQTLHECIGKSGVAAYRSGECLPGERLVAVRPAAPEVPALGQPRVAAEREAPGRRIEASRRKADGARHGSRRASATSSRRRNATRDPCASAKLARDAFQDRRGIKVTMAELSRWNHRVYDACR
jgi:hypothetical protein